MDCWVAGSHGRALYAIKPEALNDQHDTLICHCGARPVFIEDLALYEQVAGVRGGFRSRREANLHHHHDVCEMSATLQGMAADEQGGLWSRVKTA